MTHALQDLSTPTLLVPIALEALVVNDLVNDHVSFSIWQPNYGNLSNSFSSPLPDPAFMGSAPFSKPANGIYLHWVLPDALAQGQQPQSSAAQTAETNLATTNYPLVPNRWLVARISNSATQRSLSAAWVVQSDYLYSGTDRTQNGSNPFVTPNVQAFELTTLGRHLDLANWSEPTNAQPLFLKAVGPGNLTFSAYACGAMDLFAFHDSLDGLTNPPYSFSYVVLGWYSNSNSDILQGWTTADQWQSLMQTLNWTTNSPNRPVAQLPSQTVYHGLVSGVNWQNTTLPSRPNLDPSLLRVAVANTGIDGLAALVANASGSAPVNTDLIEAFQYNLLPLLNEADGAAQVEMQATEPWYGSSSGGVYWKVVPAQRANLDDTAQVTTQLDPTQAAKLASLNDLQMQLNQKVLLLQSRQIQLYDLWWKQQSINKNGYSDANAPEQGFDPPAWDQIAANISSALNEAQPNSLVNSVKQLKAAVEQLASQVPNPSDPNSILNYAQNTLQLPSTLELKALSMPRFYHPVDPVLMIGGIEWPDRYIHGGVTDAGAALPTRFQDQTLTGLQVGNTLIKATDSQLAGIIPALPASNLPIELTNLFTALLQEAFFLDSASAPLLAARYNLDLQTVTQAIANAKQAPVGGIYPSDLAVFQWQQAWSPLFLEWEVNWFATPPVFNPPAYDPDNPSQPTVPATTAPINWSFNGQDYSWSGNPPAQMPVTYRGRIFLSPHITFGFISRLKEYLQSNPNANLQAIETLIEQVGGGWNFLSQSLSGFCQDLIMKDIRNSVSPTSPLANDSSDIPSYIGAAYRAVPYTSPGDWGDPSQGPSDPATYFFPIRAGHFMLQNLQVVDRFGQIVNLLSANNNPQTDPKLMAQSFQPIYGKGLKPDSVSSPPYLLKQPPRIVQPAQLDFRFLSATDDTHFTDFNPLANPVCGWLLPNHFDQSLAVYDAAGDPLGELMRIANAQGGYSLSWQSAPGVTPPTTPDKIANLHLKQFVQGVLGLNDQGAGLQSLLQVIDETLWTVAPQGGSDQELSLLIGRPIAVVRAKVQLQLSGDPVADQAWSQTLGMIPRVTDVFTNVTFPIKLGSLELLDDGLLGYFLNDSYQQFNSVHAGVSSSYISPIGINNNYLQLPVNYSTKSSNQQTFLTLLVDPRGCIHATSGILPPEKLMIPVIYTKPATKLNVSFRVNSLLTDANAIRLPIPSLKQANWSWIERSDPNTWNTSLPVVKANQKPRLADAPAVIRDGWLKLQDQES